MNPKSHDAAVALSTVRVLDIGTMIACNYASALMGDFGAQVIKVELPRIGDALRKVGPFANGQSQRWPALARNKQCITLDLRRPEGNELFKRLVAVSDVILENFRPGTLEGWGLGYDTLRGINPKIILARISGYGQTGPYSHKAGFGTPATAFSGFTYMQGFPDRPPVSPSFSLIDYIAGLTTAWSTCMALYYRDAVGGSGQELDVSLYEPTFRMMDFLVGPYDKCGKVKERSAMIADSSSPAGTYETSDGRWVVLVCSTEPTFTRLAHAMGRADLANSPQFDCNEHRVKNNTELDAIIREWIGARTQAQVVEILDAAGAPVSPINSIADIFADPHYKAREDIIEVEHPSLGTTRMPGVVPKLSVTPGSVRFCGPELGAHNKEIFHGLLGMSDEEMAVLQAQGVI